MESGVRRGRRLVGVAAGAGLVHAAASLYWAVGGRGLLASVGQWAVDLTRQAPTAAGAVLAAVALLKLVAAGVPVAVACGRLPWSRMWRAVTWVGGSVLVLDGGVNTVVSAAVLAGVVRPEGGYDAGATAGHAFLWDPLFLVWGGFLVGSSWVSRRAASPGSAMAGAGAGR